MNFESNELKPEKREEPPHGQLFADPSVLPAYCLYAENTPSEIPVLDIESEMRRGSHIQPLPQSINKRQAMLAVLFTPFITLKALPFNSLERLAKMAEEAGGEGDKKNSRRGFIKKSAVGITGAALSLLSASCEKKTRAEKLSAALLDPDVDVATRRNAAQELALLHPNQESELVLNALAGALGDKDEEVRGTASAGLAHRGMAAVPALLNSALNPEQIVRQGVLDTLVQIGIPCALTLAKTFTNFELPVSARQVAIKAFVRILIELADRTTALREDARDPLKREPALSDLKEIKTSLQEASLQETVPLLSLAYKDNDKTIRQAAVMAIAILADMNMEIVVTEAMPHLIAALKDADDVVRQNAAGALGAIRDPSSAEALAEALNDNSSDMSQNAALALQRLGPMAKSAAPKLIKILNDADSERAQRAAKALGAIKDTQAVPHLGKALRKKDNALRAEAALALYNIGENAKEALPDLLFALRDPQSSTNVKNNTTAALGRIADPKAVPALKYILIHDKNVRYNACLALTEIFTKVNDGDLARSVVPALINALYDNALDVRIATALCLKQIAEFAENAEPALRDILQKTERGIEWDILNSVLQDILEAKKQKI